MIAVVKSTATTEQLDHLVKWIEERGFRTNVSQGDNETLVGIIGDTTQIDPFILESMDLVERVQRVSEPFKLANRKFHPDDTVVDCGHGVLVGGGNFQVIAGPCSVEGGSPARSRPPAPRCCAAARSSPAPPPTPTRAWARRASTC